MDHRSKGDSSFKMASKAGMSIPVLRLRSDARIIEERLKTSGKRISLEEIGRKYGLVD